MRPNRRPKPSAIAITITLALLVFVVDIQIPLGVAAGVPYVWVMLSSHWSPGRRSTLGLAAFCSVLTYLGFLLSPRGAEMWIVIVNRLLALCAIWITAWLCLRRKRNEILLEETTRKLKRQSGILESVLNSLREGVVVTDPAGSAVMLNPSARNLLGLHDPIKTGPADWMVRLLKPAAGQSPGPGFDPLRRVLTGRVVRDMEYRLETREQDDDRFVLLNGAPLVAAKNDPDADPAVVDGAVLTFHDITHRKKLHESIVKAIEDEQRRIGQDLHDGLIQQLTGILFMHQTLVARDDGMADDTRQALVTAAGHLHDSVAMARRLSRTMFPVELEDGGLVCVLEKLVERVGATFGVACTLHSEPIPDAEAARLDVRVSTQLFRIAQEALTNAAKHARGGPIELRYRETPAGVELSVTDHGPGFDFRTGASRGIGLYSMECRAGLIGARLTIDSRPGVGTSVRCVLPKSSRECAPERAFAAG